MDTELPKHPKKTAVRLGALLFPPAGLLILWVTKGISAGRKLFVSLVILLYTPIYAALILAILWKFFGMQYEFRGGAIPAFTWRKTLPDYDKLEASRASQKRFSASRNEAPAVRAYWTGFRGPNRDGDYREQSIITTWPASGPPLLWKQPVGGGYASFAIAGGRAFTIEQRR